MERYEKFFHISFFGSLIVIIFLLSIILILSLTRNTEPSEKICKQGFIDLKNGEICCKRANPKQCTFAYKINTDYWQDNMNINLSEV